MNMHAIDWAIVAALLAVLTIAAITTGKYTTSVSAFLAANRYGRRYLIAMANAMTIRAGSVRVDHQKAVKPPS